MKIVIGWIAQFVGHHGGMDKVFVNFANEMTRRGHDVVMVYCTEMTGEPCKPIDAKVKIINLTDYIPGHKFESYKTRGFKLRREIVRLFSPSMMKNMVTKKVNHLASGVIENVLENEKPDIIVTMDHGTASAFQKVNLHGIYPVVAMSHFDAESILKWSSSIEKEAIKNCDVLQTLMPHDITVFQTAFPALPMKWIPNIVPQYDIGEATQRLPVIIDVARLDTKQKRQHLLLEAFAKISEQFPQWKVELWGEEQRGETYTRKLQGIIQKYHLENQVKLCGNTDDVLSVYHRASIFAFPSAYEGFGLAMAEAMSAGLPVVAYRFCPAVNELVRDGETGLLVDDGVDALAEGLKRLMEDQELRERMGRAAHESMKEFAPEKIWDQWEALMQDVIAKHKAKMEY